MNKAISDLADEAKPAGQWTPLLIPNYSDRIWKHKDELKKAVRRQLLQSMQEGESLYQTTSRLQKEVGGSYYNSQRIVRTEAARVMYMAEREAWDKTRTPRKSEEQRCENGVRR